MTTMQVKQQIDAMSDEDRFLAAAYLEHLSNEREKRAGGHFVKYLHPDPISPQKRASADESISTSDHPTWGSRWSPHVY
jgi:hypothetical protein